MADLPTAFPDAGHEAIRQAVLAQVADLARTTTDAYDLTDLLFVLLDAAHDGLAQARADLDTLTARMDALETPPEV